MVAETPPDLRAVEEIAHARVEIKAEVEKRIIGQQAVIDQLLTSLFARGHCLFVGVPGLAKTLLISTLAEVLDLSFNRIQFTPDLMPSDITGTDVLEEDHATGRRVFRFIRGPLFANIVLADEINRTPPKTQAALLEAMQEHRVTVQGKTYTLDEPFHVFATQNPIELEGTYPLPEAQLDRFMFHIIMDYLPEDDEVRVATTTTSVQNHRFQHAVTGRDISAFQQLIRRVPIAEPVARYAVSLARASRPAPNSPDFIKQWVSYGASTRAPQHLILGGKARALMDGRYNVSFEDIRALAKPVLRHRVLTNFHAQSEQVTSDQIIDKLLRAVPVPKSGM